MVPLAARASALRGLTMTPAEAGMLIVATNVGITDGTLVPASDATTALAAAVERAAARAGFRCDGRYAPLDRIDFVLAGDTFDWLSSAAWCGGVKPWHGGAVARESRTCVARAALVRGRRLVAVVARWAREGIAVPAADPRGRPGLAERVRVPVRVVALAGDRDPWLAESAVAQRGLGVGACWSDGTVLVRHGHELDPTCRRSAAGDQPTLAESVAVDLVARFGRAALAEPGAAGGLRRLILTLARSRVVEIPLRLAEWLEAAVRQPHDATQLARLESLWRQTVAAWLASARRCVPACEVEFDHLAAVAEWCAGGWRRSGRTPLPAAIRRLGVPMESGHDAGPIPVVFGHAATHDGPALRLRRDDGAWEVIGTVPRLPAVVTIDAADPRGGGDRIVDAA